MAPGMALMFLMYTVSNGGRILLVERNQGTLPRLLVSPTTTVQVLGGKIFGIYLTGVAQMLILIIASTLLFQLEWGDPLGVLVLVLAAVVGAMGWGMLITALASTPGQVAAIGSAVMLTFGILGGSFFDPAMHAGLVPLGQQDHPQRLGAGWLHHPGAGRRAGRYPEPILALLVMGVRALRCCPCSSSTGAALPKPERSAAMKKIFAIIWKDLDRALLQPGGMAVLSDPADCLYPGAGRRAPAPQPITASAWWWWTRPRHRSRRTWWLSWANRSPIRPDVMALSAGRRPVRQAAGFQRAGHPGRL